MAPKRSDEFRREAVGIALTSGLTRNQVTSDLALGFPRSAGGYRNHHPIACRLIWILQRRMSCFAKKIAFSRRSGTC